MNRLTRLLAIQALLVSLCHCADEARFTPAGASAGSGAGGSTGASGSGAVQSGASSGGGAPESRGMAMVLIGGGTHVCTSATAASCVGTPDFTQQTSLPLKTQEIFRMTSAVMENLAKRPELSATITAKLGLIPQGQDYTYDGLLDAIEAVGLSLKTDLPRDSAARAAVLGYATLPQEEVVDLAHSDTPETEAMFKRFIELAGGAGKARIGVITASSEDAKDSYLFYAQVMKQAGSAEVVWIPVDLGYRKSVDQNGCDKLLQNIEEAYLFYGSEVRYPELTKQHLAACQDPKSVLDAVNGLTGFFFAGGDQAKHKGALITGGVDSAEMAAIRARIVGGEAALSGTSAGTAVACSPPMISGGETYDALVRGAHPLPCATCSVDDLIFDAAGGLGLFSYGTLDSHFSQRGRQGRLIRLASDTATPWAFGVDENTALVVTHADTPEARMEVIGQNGVSIFDLTSAKPATDSAGRWKIGGVRSSYLRKGDRYNPETHEVTFASDKKDIVGDETNMTPLPPSTDIFGEYVRITQDLCDSVAATTSGETLETSLATYKVVFDKGAMTRCFDGPDTGDIAFDKLSIGIEAL